LETIKLAERLQPNGIVLDLMMPGLTGLETLRIIRHRLPGIWEVILSMYGDEAFVSEALSLGAMGYVLKRKGKWAGGMPLLGYDVDPLSFKLMVNPEEAERVRAIFKLYLKHGGLVRVVQEL
jgi:PleD family two-component response regulator